MTLQADRASIARDCLVRFPKSLRDAVLNDPNFRKSMGLEASSRVILGEGCFSIQVLYDALSRLMSGSGDQKIDAIDGSVWTASEETEDGATWITLTSGDRMCRISEPWFVHPSSVARLAGFNRIQNEANVTGPELEIWREKISREPLDYEVIHKFEEEIANFPANKAAEIRDGISWRNLTDATLVPKELRYYLRLAGDPTDSANTIDYLQRGCRKHIDSLLNWNIEKGLRLALLLASHAEVAKGINLECFDESLVTKFFAWLASCGDRLSQVGGFELGVKHIDRFPSIAPHLEHIAIQLSQDNPNDLAGRLSLTASLFMMVEASLAKSGILKNLTPAWRRQASFAQASMIERELLSQDTSRTEVREWVESGEGVYFFLQTMVDMRREPRWMPDFIEPHQLRHEFIGRIVTSARENSKILPATLREVLIDGKRSLMTMLSFPLSYTPGPLEGGLLPARQPPDEILALIRKNLEGAVGDAATFAALVNCSLVFAISSDLTSLAAKTIRETRYLLDTGNTDTFFRVLSGLAMVAAATRSVELAQEVRVLAQAARKRSPEKFDTIDSLRIGLVAAAANEGPAEWQKFVGDLITEIAFTEVQEDRSALLLSQIKILNQIEPGLKSALGMAQAALEAFNAR